VALILLVFRMPQPKIEIIVIEITNKNILMDEIESDDQMDIEMDAINESTNQINTNETTSEINDFENDEITNSQSLDKLLPNMEISETQIPSIQPKFYQKFLKGDWFKFSKNLQISLFLSLCLMLAGGAEIGYGGLISIYAQEK